MKKIRLGRTDVTVSQTAFGCLPIQRITFDEAKFLLRKAFDNGVNLFDTARAYSDSEEKIGYALNDVRAQIFLATKSMATDRAGVLSDLKTSLRNLKTDAVDLLQLHNPLTLPDPNDPESAYAGLLEAKKLGLTRFIGMTNHQLKLADEAVRSGLYDTLQFPLSALSSPEELALIALSKQHDVGLIAMKALCGGLLTNIDAAFTFLRQFDNVAPIWGIQRESELDQFLALEKNPPKLDAGMLAEIDREKQALSGDFCRGCGYCLPCPAEIPIPMAARITLLMQRAPTADFLTPEWQAKMRRVEDCIECGHCIDHCPYGLDTPALLKKTYAEYLTYLK